MNKFRWLVTGCSSGIGEALVRSILARGDQVVASTRGNISRLTSLEEAGSETVLLDVTASPLSIKAVIDKVLEDGPIDVLVNNAGYESYQAQFDTNFFGVIKTTQAVLPHLREKNFGTIVFIGSSGGIAGEAGASPYCATKFALEDWHECLKTETTHLGIRSIIFELGRFRTKMIDPQNLRFRSNRIPDYDVVRAGVETLVRNVDGNQPGDPAKAVEVIVDVVRDEGVAEVKPFLGRLPLGADCVEIMRKKAVSNMAICN